MITVITPTYNRTPLIVQRAIGSVRAQTYQDWQQVVCTDGEHDTLIAQLVESEDNRCRYDCTGKHLGQSGDGVRLHALESVTSKYVCFIDDDNFILPTYLEQMVKALDDDAEAAFAVCQCLHFGPLQSFHGTPPVVLTGVPPKLYYIDMMQVVVRTKVMKQVGFLNPGYYSDGATFESLAKIFPYVTVPETLAVHMNH